MSDIRIRMQGKAGRITLNRPKALNALTHDMLSQMETALTDWSTDETVHLVLIDAEGDRAFCAGGDIADLYNHSKQGNFDYGRQFWRDEYRLNAAIAGYPKPFVAVMDGIVMGGGVGISAHGSHRIVTERTLFAMPECSIGLLPDVGGSLLLAQTPGYCGEYIGLTGARLSGADCIYAGLADYFVPSLAMAEMKQVLSETGDIASISGFSQPAPASALQACQADIDAHFGLGSVSEIHKSLEHAETDFAVKARKGLSLGAPLASMATFEAIRAVRASPTLCNALRTEYRFVSWAAQDGELIEGIRAAVIDKDRAPNWKYPDIDAVPKDLIERLYHAAEGGDFEIENGGYP